MPARVLCDGDHPDGSSAGAQVTLAELWPAAAGLPKGHAALSPVLQRALPSAAAGDGIRLLRVPEQPEQQDPSGAGVVYLRLCTPAPGGAAPTGGGLQASPKPQRTPPRAGRSPAVLSPAMRTAAAATSTAPTSPQATATPPGTRARGAQQAAVVAMLQNQSECVANTNIGFGVYLLYCKQSLLALRPPFFLWLSEGTTT